MFYNVHRYYDATTGQYLSSDPIGLAGGLRTRGYVENPLTWVDPLGLNGCAGANSAVNFPIRSVESSLEKVGQLRQSLDVGAKRNIAFAEYNINGEAGELVGISGNASRPGTVGIPETRRFETIATGNNTRMLDSEVKIFEHLGSRLAPDATGTLHLFSELPLCVSCSGVVPQFQQAFPGIRVIVTHGLGR